MIFNSFEFLWLIPILFCAYWLIASHKSSATITPPRKQCVAPIYIIRSIHQMEAGLRPHTAMGDSRHLPFGKKD